MNPIQRANSRVCVSSEQRWAAQPSPSHTKPSASRKQNLSEVLPPSMARLRARLRRWKTIDGGKTSEKRGFHAMDGALRRSARSHTICGAAAIGAACAARLPGLHRGERGRLRGQSPGPSSVGFADIFSPRAGRRRRGRRRCEQRDAIQTEATAAILKSGLLRVARNDG